MERATYQVLYRAYASSFSKNDGACDGVNHRRKGLVPTHHGYSGFPGPTSLAAVHPMGVLVTFTTNVDQHRQTSKQVFRCSYCNKTFARRDHLTEHIRTHTGDRPFRCDNCDRTFAHKRSLVHHQRTHTGERPYQCELCPMAFAKHYNLDVHVRAHKGLVPTHHGYSVSPGPTSLAGIHPMGLLVTFTTSVDQHRQTSKQVFRCSYCNKTFARRDHLTEHIRTHTGDRPFRCDHCDNTFVYKRSLVEHQRTHTGERPYQCELCPMAFAKHYNLVVHVMRAHKGKR